MVSRCELGLLLLLSCALEGGWRGDCFWSLRNEPHAG